jgi:Putative metal-binding motif/FG-GAP repeat
MRPILLLLPLLLTACKDKSTGGGDTSTDGGSADGGSDDDGGSGGDTGDDIVDLDGDGSAAESDCDDTNPSIYPGATEVCDGIDQDCDGTADQIFDYDGDGALSLTTCPELGNDCDDNDATIAPTATEVPYDGIDQDCTGADLTDVDGDGFEAVEVGANDCDDTDASVNPRGVEIPKDGIDQDCDGEDDIDGDGDGYGDADLGGDDCDDEDPAVNPSVTDLMNDGVDTNCDGTDGAVQAIADVTRTLEGVGSQDLLGYAISAPFGNSYAGTISVFLGSSAATWTDGMAVADADIFIEADGQFIGWDLACVDLDGDGNLDLVTSRGEIDYGRTYQADFGILGWYGGKGWPATLSDTDADFEYTHELGVVSNVANVDWRPFTAGDIDGDGKAELLVSMYAGTSSNGSTYAETDPRYEEVDLDADDTIWVIGGGRHSGADTLDDYVVAKYAYTEGKGESEVLVVSDVNGDGSNDVWVGQNGVEDTGTLDTGYGIYDYDGLGAFISGTGAVEAAIEDVAHTLLTDGLDETFSWRLAVADISGDGLDDAAISVAFSSTGADHAGGVLLYNDSSTLAGLGSVDGRVPADAEVWSSEDFAWFGYTLSPVMDITGDGVDELAVVEMRSALLSSTDRVWVVDGAASWGGGDVEDLAVLGFVGEAAEIYTGYKLVSGDFDGDGLGDLATTAPFWEDGLGYAPGKAYFILSSDLGLR